MTSSPSTKNNDPRFIAGFSECDDDMTDEAWFLAMGPAPAAAAAAPSDVTSAAPTNPAAKAWASFQDFTSDHELAVLNETGPYRHLRVAKQDTRWESWDIITWPDHLGTSGDICNGYTFSCDGHEPDMIAFFARMKGHRPYFSDGAPSIDFRYWAQKLQGDQRDTVRAYVHEDFVEKTIADLNGRLVNPYYSKLTQDLVDELVSEVRELPDHESEVYAWLLEHEEHFPDTYPSDFYDYTFHFQVACYAINHAVQAYQKLLSERAAQAPKE